MTGPPTTETMRGGGGGVGRQTAVVVAVVATVLLSVVDVLKAVEVEIDFAGPQPEPDDSEKRLDSFRNK